MALTDFTPYTTLAERAQVLADALYGGPEGLVADFELTPFALDFSIMGVGLVESYSELRITVLIDTAVGLDEGERVPAVELNQVRAALTELFGNERAEWGDCIAIGVEPGVHFVAPGDRVSASVWGTAGPLVRWANHQRGFLTAGHVALGVGSAVLGPKGRAIGTVADCWYPTQRTTGADVALVKVHPPRVPPAFPASQVGVAPPQSTVHVHTNGGPVAANVVGYLSWFHFVNSGATCNDLYLTGAGITAPGDSGSAATDAAGAVIGMAIGGTGSLASFIQDIGYQLGVIRATPGLQSLSL